MFLSKPLGNFTEFIDISFSINFSSKNKVFFPPRDKSFPK